MRGVCVAALAAALISVAAADVDATIRFDDGPGWGRRFDGIGGLSGGGATSKLLVNYPQKQRDEILDYLFKPSFGASLHILKVEIGGDAQTTDGTEASHMHNSWDENYNRGYEWWLMKEAKKRKRDIKLVGLPWAFPGWLGDPKGPGSGKGNPWYNNTQTADYIVRWINGAKQVHDLDIDYIGIHNEASWNTDYPKILRKMLDERGFNQTKIIAHDGFGWAWDAAYDLIKDPELAAAVDVVSAHYTGTYSSAGAKACGKQVWSSEDWSTFNDMVGGGCWARMLNQNYVNGQMSSTIAWNLIAAYYENLPYARTGLMTSEQPWSGYYDVASPIWVSAHHCQFTWPGWRYLKHGHGVGRLPKGGSYVTYVEGNGRDFTIVIETMSHDASKCIRPGLPGYSVSPQTVTLKFLGMFTSHTKMYVWKSKLGKNSTTDQMFIKQKDPLTFVNAEATISLGVDEVWTITSMSGGSKGNYSGVPASQPFPLPYKDDFENYTESGEPYNLSPQLGTLEIVRDGSLVARQMVLQKPCSWQSGDQLGKAIAVIGDKWSDIFIEFDFRLSPVNGSTGVFAAARVDRGGAHADQAQGVFFFVLTNQWYLATDLSRQPGKVIASGNLTITNGSWHHLSLLVSGSTAVGALDKKQIFSKDVSSSSSHAGFAALGTETFGLADFDNLHIDTKQTGEQIMRQYQRNAMENS